MQIAIHAHTFITDSQEELLDWYFPLYAKQIDRIGKSRGWLPFSKENFLAGISPEGALCMGTASQVKNKIQAMIDHFGLTRFIAHMDIGGPSHQQLCSSISSFAKEVIPNIHRA